LREQYEAKVKSNKACSDANKNTNAKYVGTSAVAQDIMHFVELQAAARGEVPEEAKINYWGISYGTVLGQTLAAMYPERLRRMLLDGNAYGVAWYQGWIPSNLDDVAHSVWMFTKLCFEAGPEFCALSEGTKSIDDVKARFDAAVSKLEAQPMETSAGPLTNFVFMTEVISYLVNPKAVGKGYAEIVNFTLFVETGDEALIPWIIGGPEDEVSEDAGDSEGSEGSEAAAPSSQNSLEIITAVDIAGRYPWKTYEEWKAASDRLQITIPYSVENWVLGNG
jgi:hypothetical protein